MNHLILLGDSIFDNGVYVPEEEPVVEQVCGALGAQWSVTLRAVDGSVTSDVADQLDGIPDDATHLIVSVGGNDALQRSAILERGRIDAGELFSELADIQTIFRTCYRDMLQQVLACGRATAVCTIYDQVPFPDWALRRRLIAALSVFNDSIIREACQFGVPVLDLRGVCEDSTDFSELSPIEPSWEGGLKIATAIGRLLQEHDFNVKRTVLY